MRTPEALRRYDGIPGIQAVTLDVTRPEDWSAVCQQIAQDHSEQGLFALINNAGTGFGGPIEYLDPEILRQQFEVNFFGVIQGIQTCLPLLRRGQPGRIINISSLSGQIVTPFLAPYCSSKFALEAMSESLRFELAPWGIVTSLIEPSMIQTPIFAKSSAFLQAQKARLPAQALVDYAEGFEAYERALSQAAGKGGQPQLVAEAVARALAARRPRLRYPVGKHAWLAVFLRKYLSDAAFEQIVSRFGVVKKSSGPGLRP